MPKNDRRHKNHSSSSSSESRTLLLREPGQEYAKITKLLGNCMLECSCYDNKVRIGTIRNKLRRGKKNRIQLDSIVLVSLRSFQDDKVDVFHVYTDEEIKQLKKMYEIPEEVIEQQTMIEFEPENEIDIDIDFI